MYAMMWLQGGLTRGPGKDRIEFLAKVRNLALEPLWREAGTNGSAAVTGEGFRADRIIFINDVYFCARDVVRPSPHREETSLE